MTRRLPMTLDATLYSYVEKANAKHAKTEGKEKYGSASAYVNALICKDRGILVPMIERKEHVVKKKRNKRKMRARKKQKRASRPQKKQARKTRKSKARPKTKPLKRRK